MSTQILFPSSFFLVQFLLMFTLATLCLSYTIANENPFESVLNRLRNNDFLDDPSIHRSLPIKVIYQFGDSYSDTGNMIWADPSGTCGKWPYGMSISTKPNAGRCSDGLLSIDYFAKFMNLSIDPYLKKKSKFINGVNFAITGGYTIDLNVSSPTSIASLSNQLDWFKSYLHSFYPNASARKNKLAEGLFFMGEIGINDYILPLFTHRKTFSDVYKMVPDVIQVIRNAIEEIINYGATRIVIPGTIPFGCLPCFALYDQTNDSNKYDELKCLRQFNKLSNFHNYKLKQITRKLRKRHPNVTIVYMDYSRAFKTILKYPTLFGFDKALTQKACCGLGHNNANDFNTSGLCGNGGVPYCKNPQDYVNWDGLHLTQHTNHILAKLLIRPMLRALHIVT